MNDTSSSPPQHAELGSVFNVPNLLTASRLLLSIVLFVVIGIAQGMDESQAVLQGRLFLASLVIFVVAAATDWVDGFWARRYGQVTVLGRIFDPFVDKVIICGVFIFLVASPESKVTAWMAVVVTGREMLVTVIRSFFEQQGTDFSAKMAGKLKMVLQCVAVVASLYLLSHTDRSAPAPAWLETTVTVSLWAAILITIYSGAEYVVVAARLMRS